MMVHVPSQPNFSTMRDLPLVPPGAAQAKRRRIDRNAGRALELIGHAIEYLTDEFVYEGSSQSSLDNRLQAIQLLMALNRQIYLECPEVKPLGYRVLAKLGIEVS